MKLITIFFSFFTLLFFSACGDNTTQTVTSDISTIGIDEENATIVYATDYLELHSTVTYQDNTTADVTDSVTWKLYDKSDYNIIRLNNNQIFPASNGGYVDVSAVYKNLADLNDTITVEVVALTDFTITSDEIKTTGEFKLEAQANFTDGTKDKVVNYNIVWYSTNSDDEITREYNEVTIEIDETGERNITASIFDINQTVTYIVK